MIKIRAAVILEKDGSLLLARHTRHGRDYWVLPGGTVERGETLEETAVRELEEEANLKISVDKLAFVSEVIEEDGAKHIIDFFFKGSIISGHLAKGPGRFLSEIKFIPAPELDTIVFYPEIKKELKEAVRSGFGDSCSYLGNRSGKK